MTWKGIFYLVTLVQLHAILVLASSSGPAEDENKIPKPFGLGQGPFFVGGRDTDKEGTRIALTIYKQFLVYKKLLGQSFLEDEQYYDRYNTSARTKPIFESCFFYNTDKIDIINI